MDRPWLSADNVVFDREGRLLLIRRGNPPFKGKFALPGGFVDVGETVEAAALRELREETGVVGSIVRLVGVYSDPKRDPRHHTISVAFLVRIDSGSTPVARDDAAEAAFRADWRDLPLAFDHRRIVQEAARLR